MAGFNIGLDPVRFAGASRVMLGDAQLWPPVEEPSGPTFDDFTIHAWDPASGSNGSGIIPNAVGSQPMYARRGDSALTSWDGVHTDYQHLLLDQADAAAVLTGANRTLTFWVRREAGSGNYLGIANYAQAYPDSGGLAGGWTLFYGEGGYTVHSMRNEFSFGNSGNITALTNSTWHMLTVTLGAGQWRAYFNGTAFSDGTWSAATNADQSTVLKFGPSEPGITDSYTETLPTSGPTWVGGFADIRVHNKILNSTEINALYAAGRLSY